MKGISWLGSVDFSGKEASAKSWSFVTWCACLLPLGWCNWKPLFHWLRVCFALPVETKSYSLKRIPCPVVWTKTKQLHSAFPLAQWAGAQHKAGQRGWAEGMAPFPRAVFIGSSSWELWDALAGPGEGERPRREKWAGSVSQENRERFWHWERTGGENWCHQVKKAEFPLWTDFALPSLWGQSCDNCKAFCEPNFVLTFSLQCIQAPLLYLHSSSSSKLSQASVPGLWTCPPCQPRTSVESPVLYKRTSIPLVTSTNSSTV